MWRDIALANRENLGRAVTDFIAELERFQTVLAAADEPGIARFFETAKQRRDEWCACGATHSPE
jgi:prephenate dehydrogenase